MQSHISHTLNNMLEEGKGRDTVEQLGSAALRFLRVC